MKNIYQGALKALFLPGGLLWFAAVILVEGRFLPLSPSVVDFSYFAVFLSGVLLAWRSQSGRTLYALLVLLLSHRALEFFGAGRPPLTTQGYVALSVISVLLPLNFIYLSFVRERGVTVPAMAPQLAALLLQSAFVAVVCRQGVQAPPALFQWSLTSPAAMKWLHMSQAAFFCFIATLVTLLVRFIRQRRPTEAGFLWSVSAIFRALLAGGAERESEAYWAVAGFILISAVIESFYAMAYNDELTGLPGRRAFNQSVLMLEQPFCIAAVDIDHFKNVNDTYGHDAGDQVLRMVAAKLGAVSGGGKAFRIGGEEFTILFRGKRAKEIMPDLETLRSTIEASSFRLRGGERRTEARGSERRKPAPRKRNAVRKAAPAKALNGELSVTVSMGVAEATPRQGDVDAVIQAADKALYRAKEGGRNRIETGVVRPAAHTA